MKHPIVKSTPNISKMQTPILIQPIFSFDFWYKLISLGASLGILTSLFKLVKWAINLEPRIVKIETQSTQYGVMIQQFTNSLSRIEGIIEGFKEGEEFGRKNKGDKK